MQLRREKKKAYSLVESTVINPVIMNKQKDKECALTPSNLICNSGMVSGFLDAPWNQEIAEVNTTLNDVA